MREGSGGFEGEAEGTAGRAQEERGEWVHVRQFQRRRGTVGEDDTDGWAPSVRERER
jgi:hypothetical protein